MRIAVDAILFDLDGVLVDSTAAVERHWSEFADTHGLDSGEVLKGVHGRQTVDNLCAFAPHLDPVAAVRDFERRETEDVVGVSALPGANKVVRGLPKDAWAVVTSGSLAVASARIGAAGLPVPNDTPPAPWAYHRDAASSSKTPPPASLRAGPPAP